MATEEKGQKHTAMTEGMSFYLDREGHKKFLRGATNQELEAENKKLKQELADKTEECDYLYTEAKSDEIDREELRRELSDTKRVLVHCRSVLTQKRKELQTERDEKHALEIRIMKALNPSEESAEPNDEEEDEEEEQEEDNSPSPSFADEPQPGDLSYLQREEPAASAVSQPTSPPAIRVISPFPEMR